MGDEPGSNSPHDLLSLLDWKRRVHEIYAELRGETPPAQAWLTWRDRRDELFRHHPQSPIPEENRASFAGLSYFDYDAAVRVEAAFEPLDGGWIELPASTGAPHRASKSGRVSFTLFDSSCSLDLFWIEGYGGGAFLPFRDRTSGKQTYGAGRYLLDTIKGADLGPAGSGLLLDFNFAYNPSCSYDPRWACPLAPPGNTLSLEITAGERTGS